MSALQSHTVWTAYVVAGSGVSVGNCVVLNAAATGFVPATLANRTAAGRDACAIALTAADGVETLAFEPQIAGVISASVSGLGAGTASAIRVDDDGELERCANSASDIIGKCDTDGVAYIDFAMPWDAVVAVAGAVIAPSSGIVTSNGTALGSATTSAGIAAQLSDETGTGALVFANTPTLVTPVIGAATGTSLVLSSYIASGGGTVATTGAGRFAQGTEFYFRSVSGSGDARFVYLGNDSGGNDLIGIGDSTGNAEIRISTGNASRKIQSNSALHEWRAHDGNGFHGSLTSSALTLGAPAVYFASDSLPRVRTYSDVVNVQTTDATVTSAFTWTITDEAVTMVTVEVCAVQSTGATTASYVRRVRIKRDGGTVTVGTVTDVSTDEEAGFATCDVTIDNSSSTGRVRVTGVAATTIEWGCVVTRLEVTHS